MSDAIINHPAVIFGRWLRQLRTSRKIVKRIFAGQVFLTPSEYTEVELGVIGWIAQKQEQAIQAVLLFSKSEAAEFKQMLAEARQAAKLTFDKIFSREMLEPVRFFCDDHVQLTPAEKKELIDAILKPLPGATKLLG